MAAVTEDGAREPVLTDADGAQRNPLGLALVVTGVRERPERLFDGKLEDARPELVLPEQPDLPAVLDPEEVRESRRVDADAPCAGEARPVHRGKVLGGVAPQCGSDEDVVLVALGPSPPVEVVHLGDDARGRAAEQPRQLRHRPWCVDSSLIAEPRAVDEVHRREAEDRLDGGVEVLLPFALVDRPAIQDRQPLSAGVLGREVEVVSRGI